MLKLAKIILEIKNISSFKLDKGKIYDIKIKNKWDNDGWKYIGETSGLHTFQNTMIEHANGDPVILTLDLKLNPSIIRPHKED